MHNLSAFSSCCSPTSSSLAGDLHKDTAAVVENLRVRYTSLKACQCYTNIGSVLVSVNPGDLSGALYSPSVFNALDPLRRTITTICSCCDA